MIKFHVVIVKVVLGPRGFFHDGFHYRCHFLKPFIGKEVSAYIRVPVDESEDLGERYATVYDNENPISEVWGFMKPSPQTYMVIHALNWNLKAARRLQQDYPDGQQIRPQNAPSFFKPWPKFLAEVLMDVITEPAQTALPWKEAA